MDGLHPRQPIIALYGFDIDFEEDVLGRDWIHGSYYDQDSVKRTIAYRDGGKWNSLPIRVGSNSYAEAIAEYGDTLLIGGYFSDVRHDSSSSVIPQTSLIKWFNDSLWTEEPELFGVNRILIVGDSILVWGDSYYDPPSQVHYTFSLSTNSGQTWTYPFNPIHPWDSMADFGATKDLAYKNGLVYTLNNNSRLGDPFDGVIASDGNSWLPLNATMYGTFARSFAIEFYKDELYMGGTFNITEDPRNPGEFISKFNGNSWENVGLGTDFFVLDLFVHDSLLFVHGFESHHFGDAQIDYLAAWNGEQWCGTPFGTFSRSPQSFGFANDTLFTSFYDSSAINGTPLARLSYFDGEYVDGPNVSCSTIGLGETTSTEIPLIIAPNPTADFLTVSHPQLKANGESSILVLDNLGRVVFQEDIHQSPYQLNLESFPSGTYHIQILNSRGVLHAKVVKM